MVCHPFLSRFHGGGGLVPQCICSELTTTELRLRDPTPRHSFMLLVRLSNSPTSLTSFSI